MSESFFRKVIDPEGGRFGLRELLDTVEQISGLEVSVYPPATTEATPAIERLPMTYRRHVSTFCRLVRDNPLGIGCGGHDATHTNRRAAREGCPFVQVCHAGVAEVIVPVFGEGEHLATVFVGQAVTEPVEEGGFAEVWRRVKDRHIDRAALRRAWRSLPRLPERRLLAIGQLAAEAIRGLTERMTSEDFQREVMLQSVPAVRTVVDLLREPEHLGATQAEMARRVHLSPAWFSRLFRRVMGRPYSDYVIERRIHYACRLLETTRAPIGRIATACGFARQSYFTRRFRTVTGMTPRAYRRARCDG